MNRTADDRAFQSHALTNVLACLQNIGGKKFNQTFIDLATGPLAADQCMIFSFAPEKSRCFLSYNYRPRDEARVLAEKYVVFGHKNDPIQEHMQEIAGTGAIRIVPFKVRTAVRN